jgi:pyruvate kinase
MMNPQYLHKPNLNHFTRKPRIIWNSRNLPIPLDFFDTNPPLNEALANNEFIFWLTVSPKLSTESIDRMLRHQGCIETIRISSSKYKNGKEILNEIERINKIIGTQKISLALDLSGPKVRTSKLELLSGRNSLDVFQGEIIALVRESHLDFITDERLRNVKVVPYKETIPLKADGDFLLISDGWNQFEIVRRDEIAVYCKALHDCVVFDFRGIDIPGMYDDIETIPAETIDLIKELNANDALGKFEWLCLSFCNGRSSVETFRKLSSQKGIKLMPKIETQRGIDNLNEICSVSDGIMIARGDLAVQLATLKRDTLEAEDSIRTACKQFNKKCVIATRIGDSLDGDSLTLNNEEIYRLKHELLFDRVSCFMLTNEILENETSYRNFLIILNTINRILQRTN